MQHQAHLLKVSLYILLLLLFLDTPGSVASSGTPFRDQLNINQDLGNDGRENLRNLFKELPKPKNEFELVAPEDEDEEEKKEEEVAIKIITRILKL